MFRESEYTGWCVGGVRMERLVVLDSPGLAGPARELDFIFSVWRRQQMF